MKKLFSVAICAAIIGWAGSASADTYYMAFGGDQWFNGDNTSHTWTFDLNNAALEQWGTFLGAVYTYGSADINAEDTITSANFQMRFYDDIDSSEYGSMIRDGEAVPGFTNLEIDGGTYSANVLSVLNDHMLTVTVNRNSGDFGVDWTRLYGEFTNNPSSAPVPEPTTMLLFGTGLAGLAAVGRRRKATKA